MQEQREEIIYVEPCAVPQVPCRFGEYFQQSCQAFAKGFAGGLGDILFITFDDYPILDVSALVRVTDKVVHHILDLLGFPCSADA